MKSKENEKSALEQCKELIAHYKKIIVQAEESISNIKAGYIALSPFQVGDKVRIILADREVEAFIGEVKVGEGRKEYSYDFLQTKKDGTISRRTLFGIYSYLSLEKIE